MTERTPPQEATDNQPGAGTCGAATPKRFLSKREEIQAWFHDRTWSLNGDTSTSAPAAEVEAGEQGASVAFAAGRRCRARTVLFPTSTADVSAILRDLPPFTPVSVVCGGHSSSNVATTACPGAVVLDLQQTSGEGGELSAVVVDPDRMQVTVGGGVTTRLLAEAVRDAGGALPLGTGDTVGVAGYVLNGGISGYFQRRLGMLGQRVVGMTVVLADGTVRELTRPYNNETEATKLSKEEDDDDDDQELFRAMLGAGSALGVVTSLTLQMEHESVFRTGGNLVVACGSREAAQTYARTALRFLREAVLPRPSVSMELVVTADYTCIVTLVFYDSFVDDDPAAFAFAQELRDAGGDKVVVDDVTGWTTWFEATSSLWPVIAEMKGDPLIRTDHCMGTMRGRTGPDDAVLDFVVTDWIGRMPFDLANQSIVEIRTLGGAAAAAAAALGSSNAQAQAARIPAGNAQCQFFADMIVAYDGKDRSSEERRQIQTKVDAIVGDAKKLTAVDRNVQVDFSATHSQPRRGCEGSDLFGNKVEYESIKSIKRKVDPLNRFRCHPFGTIL